MRNAEVMSMGNRAGDVAEVGRVDESSSEVSGDDDE